MNVKKFIAIGALVSLSIFSYETKACRAMPVTNKLIDEQVEDIKRFAITAFNTERDLVTNITTSEVFVDSFTEPIRERDGDRILNTCTSVTVAKATFAVSFRNAGNESCEGSVKVSKKISGIEHKYEIEVLGVANCGLSTDRRGIADLADPSCICNSHYAPVCGEDGKTYGNACVARCYGMKFRSGACKNEK